VALLTNYNGIVANGGVLLLEYATDPRVPGAPPALRQQQLGFGSTPSVSESFTQQTQYVSMKFGADPAFAFSAYNQFVNMNVFYQIGIDPLTALVSSWRAGTLGTPNLVLGPDGANTTFAVESVGAGARIAFLGIMIFNPLT
jgi:hypothetical protein